MKFILNTYNNSTEYYVVVTKDRTRVLQTTVSLYGKSTTLTNIGDNVADCFSHKAQKFTGRDAALSWAAYYCGEKKKIKVEDLEVLLVKESTNIEIE